MIKIKLITLLSLIMFTSGLFSQDTTKIVPDSLSIDTLTIGSTKEFAKAESRAGKLFWDAHIRLRHEFWNNQEDLNDDLDDLYSFFRPPPSG